jgi:hypothetical protein
MNKKYAIFFFVFFYLVSFSQEGFEFKSKKNKIAIPFQIINNLIIIPVNINGAKLNFLLDTGVEKTILFSLEDTDSLIFNKIEKIKIRGLGIGSSINALKSTENIINIKNYIDKNHEIYIILDNDINFSSQLGIPVHGIIGFEFFSQHFIEINYQRKKIFVYKNKESFSKSKLKRFDQIPIVIESEKPFINALVSLNDNITNTKLLIDTGGSDALWLFENNENIKLPPKYFQDFLGRGFSGNIYGKRSRIEKIKMGSNEIISPTISFPDSLSLKNVTLTNGRNGSIGSEILRRFTILFDYTNKKMYLKKNTDFKDPFNYNMSGIEIQHSGLQLVKEEIPLYTKLASTDVTYIAKGEPTSVKYQFSLKPIYEIINVRPDSPAAIAGLKKGDVILKINGSQSFKYKLQQINQLMQSEEGKKITLEIERNKTILKFRFQLKKTI